MVKTGSEAALKHAMEGARRAVFGRETDPEKPRTPHYVYWMEFEATEEDAVNLRDFARLLPTFSGRYYKRKGEI